MRGSTGQGYPVHFYGRCLTPMRSVGLEPTRYESPAPQAGASAVPP